MFHRNFKSSIIFYFPKWSVSWSVALIYHFASSWNCIMQISFCHIVVRHCSFLSWHGVVTRVCLVGVSKCYGSYFFPPISTLVISVPPFLHRDWSLNKPSYKSVTFCDWLWHHGSVSQTLYNLSLTRASLRTVLPWNSAAHKVIITLLWHPLNMMELLGF